MQHLGLRIELGFELTGFLPLVHAATVQGCVVRGAAGGAIRCLARTAPHEIGGEAGVFNYVLKLFSGHDFNVGK